MMSDFWEGTYLSKFAKFRHHIVKLEVEIGKKLDMAWPKKYGWPLLYYMGIIQKEVCFHDS